MLNQRIERIMHLESEHIKLRAIEPEDLETLYEWENDTSLWIHGNTLAPYSKLALREYINNTLSQDLFQSKQLRLMICLKSDRTVIGTIDLYDIDLFNSRSGIGILIDKNFRNKNYASEVLKIIQDYTFNFLNLHSLYSYIACENKISIQLFQNAGYVEVGLLKDWIVASGGIHQDVFIFQLTSQ
ncbi:MAG: GNAT family N-acetyltransferase [Dysgonomonas sp.]